MKPNWKLELKTIKDEPIKENDKPVTLEDVVYASLLVNDHQAQESGDEKLKKARLAKKVVEDGEVSIEEAALIKKVIGKYQGPMIVLAVEEALEGQKD